MQEVKKETGIQDGNPSLVVTQQIVIGRMGDISCPVACGLVLLGDIDISAVAVDDAAARLYSEAESEYVTRLSSMNSLEMILSACQRNEIRPPRLVGARYSGEWVEFGGAGPATGSLQPAVWFRFLQKDEAAGGLKERWEFLAGE